MEQLEMQQIKDICAKIGVVCEESSVTYLYDYLHGQALERLIDADYWGNPKAAQMYNEVHEAGENFFNQFVEKLGKHETLELFEETCLSCACYLTLFSKISGFPSRI